MSFAAMTGSLSGRSTASSEVSERHHALLFFGSLIVLTGVSLWPIWATRFLPMQDYPQHLFLAQVIGTYDDPSFNWKEFYRVDLGAGPYMLWYAAMKLLGGVVSIESAGKIIFSFYLLLITALALAARRLSPEGCLPWGSLLLFPFAFNQMYFMGFTNFIISLPLVFLVLLDLDKIDENCSFVSFMRHGIYMVLIFLSHPYSLLVYIFLAATSVLLVNKKTSGRVLSLLPALVMSVILALWYFAQHGASSAPSSKPWAVHWLPVYLSCAHYMLQFTGMRLSNGVDWLTVALWGLVAVLFYDSWRRSDKGGEGSKRLVWWYLASVAGFLLLPSWMGYYSYFNLRLAPVSYFALSLLLCRRVVSLRCGAILTCLVLALLVQSTNMQKKAALETESVLPVVSMVPKNKLILPLMYQSCSQVLEPMFFRQLHANEAFYYHVIVGGGANPNLFPNAMMPVQYRAGLQLPYPRSVEEFSWSRHGAYYDYVLVRGAPQEVSLDLVRTCDVVAKSGPWVLFKNKAARAAL